VEECKALPAARHVPHGLDGRLAQHGVAEVLLPPVAAVDIVDRRVEARVVDEYGVHAVPVHVEVPDHSAGPYTMSKQSGPG